MKELIIEQLEEEKKEAVKEISDVLETEIKKRDDELRALRQQANVDKAHHCTGMSTSDSELDVSKLIVFLLNLSQLQQFFPRDLHFLIYYLLLTSQNANRHFKIPLKVGKFHFKMSHFPLKIHKCFTY